MRYLLISLLFIFFMCTPKIKTVPQKYFQKENHHNKIYIAPIINNAQLDLLPGWPDNQRKEKSLLKSITNIRTQLKDSFLLSECADNYLIVDDTSHPTIRLSITIKSASLKADSLQILLLIEIERLSDGMIKEYSMVSYASSTKRKHILPGLFLEQLFFEYNRQFPYSIIVSLFCPH